ncbi:MAG: CPBP family intramembrane metalloprotease [Firmicutes bacterium]|jgi:membrane protease YdiL (CAAX protease family)|nr:CPBP family intramembrane metalloprotease [Bacillota bacterium]
MQPREGPYSSVWDLVTILVISLVVVPALAYMSCNMLFGAVTNFSADKIQQINLAIAMSAQEAALFLLPWGVVWSVGGSLKDIGHVWRKPLQDALAGIGLGIVCLFVSLICERISVAVFGLFLDNATVMQMLSQENELVANVLKTGHYPWLRLYMWALVVLVVPISEETFFRGYVLSVFNLQWGKVKSLVMGSLLFAAVHGYVIHFLQVFLVGMLLGYAYQKRKTLLTPILAHGIMNLLAAVAVSIS